LTDPPVVSGPGPDGNPPRPPKPHELPPPGTIDCTPPTKEQVHTLCMAGLTDGTFTKLTAPEECNGCLGKSADNCVIPIGSGCDPTPTVCGDVGTWWHPFSADSPQNKRIPAGASYSGDGDLATRSIKSAPWSWINANNGWGNNTYLASDSDPVRTVRQSGPYPGNMPFPFSLHVPAGANNGGTSDAQVIIGQPNGDVHEFYLWRGGDSPTASFRTTYKVTGLGVGPGCIGASISCLPGLFGLLRGHEVNSPGTPIEHVLNFALPSGRAGDSGNMLSGRAVWPATSSDKGSGGGGIPHGGLLALPRGVNVAGLGLSEAGTRVAAALQDYGGYVMDQASGPVMRADQGVNPGALNGDMKRIWPLVRLVTSNGPGSGVPAAKCVEAKK